MKKSLTNSNPKLSVIIVNFNTGKLLQECVDSIVKTTNNLKVPTTEIIIVDNASTDGSAKILKNNDSISRIIENKTNPGFSVANNQGIKESSGEYILLLNPDTKVLDASIKDMVEFSENRKDVGVVGAKLVLADGSIQKSVFRNQSILNATREFWFGQDTYSSYVPESGDPVVVDGVVGAAFLITPEARKKVGLLDERYFMYFEDLDYCKKVRDAGLKVYYLPKVKIIHYHGVSGKLLSDSANQWRRLVPSSKIYHGVLKHMFLSFVIWFGTRVLHRKNA